MTDQTLDLYKYHAPGADGMCKFDRMITYNELFAACNQALKQAPGQEEGATNYKGEPLTFIGLDHALRVAAECTRVFYC